jgi:hypothetical protein
MELIIIDGAALTDILAKTMFVTGAETGVFTIGTDNFAYVNLQGMFPGGTTGEAPLSLTLGTIRHLIDTLGEAAAQLHAADRGDLE